MKRGRRAKHFRGDGHPQLPTPVQTDNSSTHECDVHIDGLSIVLTGHIIPKLSIASLFGIRVLTAAGCKVRFDNPKCAV